MKRKFLKRKFKRGNKAKSVKKIAYKALRLATKNKPELKYAQPTTTISATVNYGGAILAPYRYIAQGTGDANTRIGDKIRATGLQMRMSFFFPATLSNTVYRVVAFIYKHNPDNVIVNTNTILNMYMDSLYHNTSQAPLFLRDFDNRFAFKTLYDRTFSYSKDTTTVPANKPHQLRLKIPAKYAQINYFQGGTQPNRNELFILLINDKSASDLFCDWNFRLTYTDA